MPAEDSIVIRMRAEGGAVAEVEIGGVKRQLRETGAEAERSSKKVGGFGKAMGGLKQLAGMAMFAGAAAGIADVTRKTMALQGAQAQLRQTLVNTHQPVARSADHMEKYADHLSTAGGFDPTQNINALNTLESVTKNVHKAETDLSLATDLARKKHMDLHAATRIVVAAEQGRTGALRRMGIVIPQVTTAQDALTKRHADATDKLRKLAAAGVKVSDAQKYQIEQSGRITPAMRAQAKAADLVATAHAGIATLATKAGGATKAYASTAQGSWSDLRNEAEQMQTTLGQKLLPAITSVARYFAQHKTLLKDLVVVVAGLTAAYVIYTATTKTVEAVTAIWNGIMKLLRISTVEQTGAQEALNVTMAANPIGLVVLAIAALVAAFVIAYNKVGWFRKGVNAALNWVKNAAIDVFNWVKHNWPLLAGILFGPFGFAVAQIIKHWKQVKSFITGLPGVFKSVGSAIAHALMWPFKFAFEWVKKHLPTFHTHHIGPVAIPLPSFPGLQGGGQISSPGIFTVGEAGPERVFLPTGAVVEPSGGFPGATPPIIHNYLVVDGQILAQAVTRASSRQLAVR